MDTVVDSKAVNDCLRFALTFNMTEATLNY